MDSRKEVERSSDLDENIVYTLLQKEVNLSILHHKEDKEIKKLFHMKIHIKKIKVDGVFNSGSQANLIVEDMVSKLGLEVHDHPRFYPFGQVNKDT